MSATLRLFLFFILFVSLSCNKNDGVDKAISTAGKCELWKSIETNFQNNQTRRFEAIFDESINSTKEIIDSKDGKEVYNYKNFYDDKGFLIKREQFTEGGIKNFTITYEYHKNGNLKSTIKDSETQIFTNTYTESGKPLTFLQRNKSQSFDFGVLTYQYNKNGDQTFVEFTFFKELIYRIVNTYDKKNRLIKRVDTNAQKVDITEYAYNQDDKLAVETKNSTTKKEYYYVNKRLVETVQKSAGVFTYGEKHEYDSEGRESKVLMSKNGKDYANYLEKQYFPNSNQMKNYKVYFFQPNSLNKSFLIHDYTYDQKGNQVKSLLYDSQNGRPLTQLDMEYKCK